jgi:hypothetical protein
VEPVRVCLNSHLVRRSKDGTHANGPLLDTSNLARAAIEAPGSSSLPTSFTSAVVMLTFKFDIGLAY